MDPTILETVDQLRKAQEALRRDMKQYAQAGAISAARLRHLRQVARSLQEQAHSLLLTMLYEKAPETLQQEVDALTRAFSDVVHEVEAMLASDRRVS